MTLTPGVTLPLDVRKGIGRPNPWTIIRTEVVIGRHPERFKNLERTRVKSYLIFPPL